MHRDVLAFIAWRWRFVAVSVRFVRLLDVDSAPLDIQLGQGFTDGADIHALGIKLEGQAMVTKA